MSDTEAKTPIEKLCQELEQEAKKTAVITQDMLKALKKTKRKSKALRREVECQRKPYLPPLEP